MKRAVLIFPDTSSLADFLLSYQLSHAEVASGNRSLTAFLTDEQIVKACTQYGAVLSNRLSSVYEEE